jgi:uridine kinase
MVISPAYIEIIEQCYDELLQTKRRPLLIAVTGDSGSGKSHYAQLLVEYLKMKGTRCACIDADDFLISRAEREPMKHQYYTSGEFKGKTHWEILENMFRLDVFGGVIGDLRAGRPATYYPYHRSTGEVAKVAVTVHPEEFIVFDTSMLLDKMDFIILIDVTRENIIKRKLERDKDIRSPEQIIEMHAKVQGYYWDRQKPKHPDVVIDNNDFSLPRLVAQV